MREPRKHLNQHGQVCFCGFTTHLEDPEHLGSVWKTAGKMEWLRERPDKKLQTHEGQQLLNTLENRYLTENTDDLMPWVAREWKKNRLYHDPNQQLIWTAEQRHNPETDQWDTVANEAIHPQDFHHWGDWFQSNSPTRRGVDLMQQKVPDIQQRIKDWDEELAQQMDESQAKNESGIVVHKHPDGWSIRRIKNSEEARDEGDQMGHCVGSYGNEIENENSMIYSLRDPQNGPHATIEIRPERWKDLDGNITDNQNLNQGAVPHNGQLVQIQGKSNADPIPEYKDRIADWFQSFPHEHRPYLPSNEEYKAATDVADLTHEDYPENLSYGYGYRGGNQTMADEYGVRYDAPPVPKPDYPQVIKSLVDESGRTPTYNQGPESGDKGNAWDVYQFAKQQGHLPELGSALQEYGDKAQENFNKWYYAPQVFDPETFQPIQYPKPEQHPDRDSYQQALDHFYNAEQTQREHYMSQDPYLQSVEHTERLMRPHFDPERGYQNEVYEGPHNPPQMTLFTKAASKIRVPYYRFVFSPQDGAVALSDNRESHPAFLKTHHDMAAEQNTSGLYHGYAYRLGNGWRLTTWDHKPLYDPYIVRQVAQQIRRQEGGGSNWDFESMKMPNFQAFHYGSPVPA